MSDNSILAVDFGNVHTRALLIDLVEGSYRLVAQAHENTTVGFPLSDVGVGFRRAVNHLSQLTGRRLLQQDGTVITPEQTDRSGVDVFVATASIGRPLRTVLIGLMPDMSIASAQRAAAGTYVNIVDVISLDDRRSPEEQLNAIVVARPDLIFITGGTEFGATNAVLEQAQTARLALRLIRGSINVLYAGNSALAPQIQEMFDNVAMVFVADNVRPTLESEALASAQNQLATAFNAFAAQRGFGFDDVGVMSRVGILPTAQSYHVIVGYLGRTMPNSNILAVDVGSAVSTIAASLDGHTATTIRTDIGVGHSAGTLIDVAGLDAVRKWLPFYATNNEILAYALNKSLRPATIPETRRALFLEHALVRAALSGLVRAGRPSWTPTYALDDLDAALPSFAHIIGAGESLIGTGRPTMMTMLMLDAIQPTGIARLYADTSALIAALGALARVKPEVVVQMLDEGGLEDLGTCFNLSGVPRRGQAAARVTITTASGDSETYTVRGGELWIHPLSIGVRARVQVSVVGRGLSIGGKRRVRIDVEGGAAGLVVDARGRPLPLATNVRALATQITEWYAQATGDPVFPLPEDWLTPIIEEPNIESVTDDRRQRSRRTVKELNAATDRAKSRRGRRRQEAAEAVETEGDEDDIRSLLS